MTGDSLFVEHWFNQGTWGKRMQLQRKLGWRILTPDQGLDEIDGASHCVRGIYFGKQGW